MALALHVGFGTMCTLCLAPVLKFCPQNNAHMQVEPVMNGKSASSFSAYAVTKKIISHKLQ